MSFPFVPEHVPDNAVLDARGGGTKTEVTGGRSWSPASIGRVTIPGLSVTAAPSANLLLLS